MANALDHLKTFCGYRVVAFDASGERQWSEPFGNYLPYTGSKYTDDQRIEDNRIALSAANKFLQGISIGARVAGYSVIGTVSHDYELSVRNKAGELVARYVRQEGGV